MGAIKEINIYIKKNIILIISFLILLQPIIDLIIGVSIHINFFPSIMSLIRMFILLFLLYYFIFINKTTNKNKISVFLVLIIGYLLFYFINMDFSLWELKSAIKAFYFPILFIIFYSIFEEENTFIDRKYLLTSLFIYSSIIIIGFLTNTAFDSYAIAKVGTSGYFNAANEIGAIIAILLPFVFFYVFDKINLKKLSYFILIIIAIIILGTKTPIISLLLCSIYFIGRLVNKNNVIKISLVVMISVALLSILVVKTPMCRNLIIHAEFLDITNATEVLEDPQVFDEFFLGSRLRFLEKNTNTYLESPPSEKMLGIGYKKDAKTSEMDVNDIFYRHGIAGFLIYFVTIFYLILTKKPKSNKSLILPTILIVLIAAFVGHVITSPAVAIIVSIVLYGSVKEEKT